jgi:hypothetical protein
MGFEIAHVIFRRDRLTLLRRQASALQSDAQRRPFGVVSRAIDFFFGEIADERPAAEKISKMPLLIGPGGDFDREIRTTGILLESACNFEPINDAER